MMLTPSRSTQRAARRSSTSFELKLFLPAFVLVVIVSFVPFGYAIVQSFHEFDFLDMGAFNGIDNYWEFLSERSGIGNTLVFVAGNLAVAVPIGVLLALALDRVDRFREIIRTILIVPWLVSSVVAARVWSWLLNGEVGPIAYFFDQFGIDMPSAATSPVLAMPTVILAHAWTAFPLVMVLTLAALQTIPKEVFEAARLDGAVGRRQLLHITLPLIRNTLLVLVVLTSINAFNHVTLIFVMTGGGPVDATNVLSLRVFEEGFRFYNLGVASAGAMVLFALNIVFTIAYVSVLRSDRV